MTTPAHHCLSRTAILALAEIKAATAAFDAGEINVFDAWDAILVAAEAYRAAAEHESRREAA